MEYIAAEEVRRHPFRIALTPVPSLHSALRDAAGAGRSGTPEPWCAAIRAHLRGQDHETLAPFVTSGPLLVPDCLVGLAEPPGESLKDGVERIMATPLEELSAQLEESREFSDAWLPAARDPLRWMRRYVTSLLRAWKGFAPIWRHARGALDREVERVGIATVLDAQLELLDGLVANGEVVDGHWCFRWGDDEQQFGFPSTGLVLLPMVAGERGSMVAGAPGRMGHIGYPVRAALGVRTGEASESALEGLLGVPRAQILRLLERPTSVGRLAETLGFVPSAATHHVSALEGAGLVARDRRGRHVLVSRTPRGDALLDLYDEVAPSRITSGLRAVGSRRGRAS